MEDTVLSLVVAGFRTMLWLTLVPLTMLVVVGLVTSLVLSILQIQDQALPTALKIAVLVVSLIALAPWMSNLLVSFTERVYDVMAVV